MPILQLKGIVKTFPGVVALNGVDFDLNRGEVHVLVGENGAGKSTLIKIVSGAYRKDRGEITIDDQPIEIHSPRHAQALGISTVYQEFNLIPFLSVAENIFLGRQFKRGKIVPVLDRARMRTEARALLNSLEIDIDPRTVVRRLGVAQKQMVEIAKAFAVKAKICIFDEPTAALTRREIEKLFQVILKFKREGAGIIYISHRLEEVFRIGDRITVLRNGEYVATTAATEVNTDQLIEMMIGRKVEEELRRRGGGVGDELLRVEALCGSRFRDVNLTVRSGEIVGVAGLVGSGRTELLRAVFGADRLKSGRVLFKGEPVQLSTPRHAARQKIALLPEDRKRHGLVMCRSVEENITLSALDRVSHLGVLIKSRIAQISRTLVQSLMIKTPSLRQPVMYLSGGNQQKVIIARWLSAESDLLMFDEPTRGIDVGAKQEVYHLIFQLAEQKKGILVVSSEIPELMRICDRIYVMHEGRVSAELEGGAISSDRILNAAFGRANGSPRQ